MATAVPQTDSRLLDSSHVVLELCDVDHTGFNKANTFILCTYAIGNSPHGNDNADYKLEWRRQGGIFADVAVDTEIAWGDSTDFTPNIVDENETVTTDSNCLTANAYGQNVGNNALAGSMSYGETILLQWGLKFGSGALDNQEYEFQLTNTSDTLSAICSVSITTAVGATLAYKDVTLKTSITSATTYKDVAIKTSLTIPSYPQTDSRIANASASWQGACDVDITNWNENNEFILSTYTTGGGGNKNFKLQYRRNGGSWGDVDPVNYLVWGSSTVLVDGDPVANPAGCLSSTKSVENEGDNIATLDSMGASDVGEIQWALGIGDGYEMEDLLEFKLINTTDNEEVICSCSITLRQHSIPQTDSRIADSSSSWQGACDVSVVDWIKTDEFILSTYILEGDGTAKTFKLQFDKDGDLNWTDVGVDTEVRWATSGETVLVDGNTVATPAGCQTSDVSVENETDNIASISPGVDDWGEIQWGLGFGSGAEYDVEYSFRIENIALAAWGNPLATITLLIPTVYKDVAIKVSLESEATTAYKDITLKTTLESALTYKDIALKTTLESALTYKDITLKTSLTSSPSFKDIVLKTSFTSNNTYKDITLKTTLDSLDYKDVALKTTLNLLGYKDVAIKTSFELGEVLVYKDITLKTSLESALTYKDITIKTSLHSLDYKDIALKTTLESALTYKDITLKTSFTSATTYKDISLKTTLQSIPTFKDITLKTTLDSLVYKDISLKVSLQIEATLDYKDIALKTSFTSAPTYKDITLKTSLHSLDYKDIVLKTSLDSLDYKDITLKTSLDFLDFKDVAIKTTLESALTYKDITLKTTFDSLNYKDIVLKTTLNYLGFKDVALKISLEREFITGYKDISLKTSLDYYLVCFLKRLRGKIIIKKKIEGLIPKQKIYGKFDSKIKKC